MPGKPVALEQQASNFIDTAKTVAEVAAVGGTALVGTTVIGVGVGVYKGGKAFVGEVKAAPAAMGRVASNVKNGLVEIVHGPVAKEAATHVGAAREVAELERIAALPSSIAAPVAPPPIPAGLNAAEALDAEFNKAFAKEIAAKKTAEAAAKEGAKAEAGIFSRGWNGVKSMFSRTGSAGAEAAAETAETAAVAVTKTPGVFSRIMASGAEVPLVGPVLKTVGAKLGIVAAVAIETPDIIDGVSQHNDIGTRQATKAGGRLAAALGGMAAGAAVGGAAGLGFGAIPGAIVGLGVGYFGAKGVEAGVDAISGENDQQAADRVHRDKKMSEWGGLDTAFKQDMKELEAARAKAKTNPAYAPLVSMKEARLKEDANKYGGFLKEAHDKGYITDEKYIEAAVNINRSIDNLYPKKAEVAAPAAAPIAGKSQTAASHPAQNHAHSGINYVPAKDAHVARGHSGEHVDAVQAMLKIVNPDVVLTVNGKPHDGLFGPKTEAALINYQKSHGLAPTGKVDGHTLESLQATAVAVVKGRGLDINADNLTTGKLVGLVDAVFNTHDQKFKMANAHDSQVSAGGAKPQAMNTVSL